MTWKIILGLAFCFLVSGCGDTFKGKSIAEPQIATFHERLDAGRFEEIYSTADEEFQKAAPKEKILEMFGAINRKLGKVKSSTVEKWNVRTFNFITTVVFVAQTEFENGKGTETFTFRVSGDKATLVGYYINSMDMMTR